MRRGHAVAEHTDGPHQRSHAGRGLAVTHDGLGRRDEQRVPALAVHREQRADLDGIPERGARAVSLDPSDVGRFAARVGQRGAHHGLLGSAARGGESVAAPIMVHRRAMDDREYAIVVSTRSRERLEEEEPRRLAAHVAIGLVVEGATPARRRQRPDLGEVDGGIGGQQEVDPPGERLVALALAERPNREVNGHVRGAARGLDRHGGAVQTQRVADATRRHARERPGARVHVEPLWIARVEGPTRPVDEAQADVDPSGAPRLGERGVPGVLERLPRDLEEQALLRVQDGGFARRDAEHLGLELVDPVEEAPHVGNRGAPEGRADPGGPSPRRCLADRINAIAETLPGSRSVDGAPRQPQPDPHDRNRVVTHGMSAIHVLGPAPGSPSREMSRRVRESRTECPPRARSQPAPRTPRARLRQAMRSPRAWPSRHRWPRAGSRQCRSLPRRAGCGRSPGR